MVGEILLYFYVPHVPMERFFDGTDQENSKKQGKNGGKKKERFLHSWRFPYSSVLLREGWAVTFPTTY